MNILLLQLKRIGDLVLTTPAIAAVRARFPEADISLVVSSGTRELLPAIPGVDRGLVIRTAADWLALVRRRWEYCVDFTHNDRSALLTLLSRARLRVTADHVHVQSRIRALCYNRLVASSLRDLHTVDHYLKILEPLDIRDASPALQLQLPSSALAHADRVLTENQIDGDFVLLHPGAARIEKYWEADRWAEVLDYVTREGLRCLVTGGDSVLEQTHLAEIRSASGAPFVDLSGRVDLLTLTALINKARLLVTVDSAPVHLAAAMQTPQVILYGPTNPQHWRPRHSPAVVLQAGQPAPLQEFSPEQPPGPMNLISTEQAIDGMKALLATPRGATL